jgi:DHA1 family multidrug resistance protein-like MFS transporter
MALIPLIYSEESLGMAMGVFGASFGLGMALGPVIGPGLAAVTSVYIPFLFASALAMASAVLALKLPDYRGSDIVKHVFKIPNDRNILLLSIVGFSLMFSMGTLVVIYPKFLLDVLGFSVRELAVLLSLASLTFAFLQPLFGKLSDKVGRRKLIPMGLGVTFIAMLGVAFSTSFSMISIMMFLFGVSGAVIFPSATGLLGERSTSSTVGTNSGFFNMMVSLGVTVAPIVVGLTSDIFGYTMGFLVPPILLVIGLISSLLVR